MTQAETIRLDEALASRQRMNGSPHRTEAPLPLFPAMPGASPYPVEMLGPVLSRAATAIGRKVQVPIAAAAQSVLAAASLVAQAHADVLMPYGQARPLSLYLTTVLSSGDRKTSADNEALWPVRKREKALKEKFDREYQDYAVSIAVWTAERKKIEADKKHSAESRRNALLALGAEPLRPLFPFLTAPDPTIEGLIKAWPLAPAALGVFTAEGGQFIGGHSMSPERVLSAAAQFSELWDARPIKRVRALDGVTILEGRRLSLHLMVQPEAAAVFLSDPTLRDQGFLSRILVASPASLAGTRLYRDTHPNDDAAINAYGARLLEILEAPLPLAEGSRNELHPYQLTINKDATSAWRKFFDVVEQQSGRHGPFAPIRDFASKAAEHAARIAGVITITEDYEAREIGLDAMACALKLTEWYAGEALRLARGHKVEPALQHASDLLDWMRQETTPLISVSRILQYGPRHLRTKASVDSAIKILMDHGWVDEPERRPRKFRVNNAGVA